MARQITADEARDIMETDPFDPAHRKGVWWLASYPKSGNTWVRMFINAYINNGFCGINNIDPILANGPEDPIVFQSVCPVPINTLTPSEIVALRGAYTFAKMAKHSNRNTPFIMKSHSALTEHIPTSITRGAIYIVRDPRDVVISQSKHFGLDIDTTIKVCSADDRCLISNSTIKIPEQVMGWSSNIESWLNAPFSVYFLKYEDLLKNPTKHFKEIIDFLQWEVYDDLIERSVKNTSLDKLKEQEEKYGFLEASSKAPKFFGDGKGWQNVLTDKQVAQIEKDHGPMMKRLGYELVSEIKEAA